MKFLEFIISLFTSPNKTKNRVAIFNSGKGAKIRNKTKNVEQHYTFNNVVNLEHNLVHDPLELKIIERRRISLFLFMTGSIGVLGALNLKYNLGVLFVFFGLILCLVVGKFYVQRIETLSDKMDVIILPFRKFFLTILVDKKVDQFSFLSALLINFGFIYLALLIVISILIV